MTDNNDDDFQLYDSPWNAYDYSLPEEFFISKDVFEPSYNPDVPYEEQERVRREIEKHLMRPEIILFRAPWGYGKTTMIKDFWINYPYSAFISNSYEHLETHLRKFLSYNNVIVVKGLEKSCPLASKNSELVNQLRNIGFKTKEIHKYICEEEGVDYEKHKLECPYNRTMKLLIESKGDMRITTVFAMALNNPLLWGKIKYWFIDEEQSISNFAKVMVPEDLVNELKISGRYIENWQEMKKKVTERRNSLKKKFLETRNMELVAQGEVLTNLLEVVERRIILPNKYGKSYTSHEGGLAEVWTTPKFHLFLLRLARTNYRMIQSQSRELATPRIVITSASAKYNHMIGDSLNFCLKLLRFDQAIIGGYYTVILNPWNTPIVDITSEYPVYKTTVVSFQSDKRSYSKRRIDETDKYALLNHIALCVHKYLQLQNTPQTKVRGGMSKDTLAILLIINSKNKALELREFKKHTSEGVLKSLVKKGKLTEETKILISHLEEVMYPGDAVAGYNPSEKTNLIVVYGDHIHVNANTELLGLDKNIVATRSGASLKDNIDPTVAKYVMDSNLTDIMELIKRSRGKRDVVYIGNWLNPHHETMGRYIQDFCNSANVEVLQFSDI